MLTNPNQPKGSSWPVFVGIFIIFLNKYEHKSSIYATVECVINWRLVNLRCHYKKQTNNDENNKKKKEKTV